MRLVTTLLADSLAALERHARRAATPWVEVRLDALPGLRPEGVAALRRAAAKPAIASCRRKADGGLFEGPERAREALLRAALAAGFEAVDAEADAPFLRALAAEAARARAELVVSLHSLEPAARLGGLEALFAKAPRGSIVKVAARVEGPEDLAALLEAAAALRARGLRFTVMGLGDASLRLLAPLLGSALVYCAPPEGPAAAPGQVPAALVARAHAVLPSPFAPSGAHRLVALLGDPVAHSLSPALQNAAFAAQGDALVYVALRTPRARLAAVLRGLRAAGFAGANITTPLKEAVLPLLDGLAPEARAARAVNTIVAKGTRLVGHTTDGLGAVAALREAGAEPTGSKALVVGAGATGRAVAHALADAGAHVLVTNRTAPRARALAKRLGGEAVPWRRAALAAALARARLVVHCTPLGRDGRSLPFPAALLGEKHVVLDAVYRPGGTPLERAARERGAEVLPGEALLLHQGALAYELWTGKRAPAGVMRWALLQAMGDEP